MSVAETKTYKTSLINNRRYLGTVCILIIRPIAAVAATELFVFNKTANRKIRRIFCY